MARRRSQLRPPPQDVSVVASTNDPTPLVWWRDAQPKGSYRVTELRILPSAQGLYEATSTYRSLERQPPQAPFDPSLIEPDRRRQFYAILSTLPSESLKDLKNVELFVDKDDSRRKWLSTLCAKLQNDDDINISRLKAGGVFTCNNGESVGKGDHEDQDFNIFTFKDLSEIDLDWSCDRDDGDEPHEPHTCSPTDFNTLLANSPNVRKIRLCFPKAGLQPAIYLKELSLCDMHMEKLEDLVIDGDGVYMEKEALRTILEIQPASCRVQFKGQDARDRDFMASTSSPLSPSLSTSSVASSTYEADRESDENDDDASAAELSDASAEETVTFGPIPTASANEESDGNESGNGSQEAFCRSGAPSPPSIVNDSQPGSPYAVEEADIANERSMDGSLEVFVRSAAPSPPSIAGDSRPASPTLSDRAVVLSQVDDSPHELSDVSEEGYHITRGVGGDANAHEDNDRSDEDRSESPDIFVRSAAPSPPSFIDGSQPNSLFLNDSVLLLSRVDDSAEDVPEQDGEEGNLLHLTGLMASDDQHWILKTESDSDVEEMGEDFMLDHPNGLPVSSTSAGTFEALDNVLGTTEGDESESNAIGDSPGACMTSPWSAMSEPFLDTPPAPTVTLEAPVKEEEESIRSQSDY